MTQDFDAVIIGTGSAASSAASRCRAAGWQVAVIDSRPFGGTCALRGCDPKKVLVGAAELVDWNSRMQAKGVTSPARLEWSELMRFKRTFTDPVPHSRERSFEQAGIAAFHGRARFTGPRTVQVGCANLRGRYIVIAAGARPATLSIPGEEHVIHSDRFLELDQLPASIVFIGGGYIAFEFAHLAARAGAQITILHRGSRPLPQFDPDLVDRLVARTRALGVDVRLGSQALAVEKQEHGFTVRTAPPAVQAALVVHAAGRVPEIDDLNLEAAGVQYDPAQGVTVNEFLQSPTNPAVYAAGDAAAAGAPRLTPVAGYQGALVASNLLDGNRHKAEYHAVPSVVFTVPPLSAVGQLDQNHTKPLDTSGWYSSRRVAETCTGAKILVDPSSGRILGAHLLGPGADELINTFALAIRFNIPAAELKQAFFAYPTHGSDIPYML